MKSLLTSDAALARARKISLGFSAVWITTALLFFFLKTEGRIVVVSFAVIFSLIGIVLCCFTLFKTEQKPKNFDPLKGTFLARWKYTPEEWALFTSANINDNRTIAKGSGIALFIAFMLILSMIWLTDETINFQSSILGGLVLAAGFGSLVWMLVRVFGLMCFVRSSRIEEPEAVLTTSQLRIGNEEYTWGALSGLLFRSANIVTENSLTFLEFEFSGRNNSDVKVLVPRGKEAGAREIMEKLNERK